MQQVAQDLAFVVTGYGCCGHVSYRAHMRIPEITAVVLDCHKYLT